ncbi:dihydrofolate reductase family protein [Nocardiopsis kunsanensis]|uniref:Dihydrofolate reductase n=1 Tax=Nocardiopsis kunsanensis TaxID=141693 RepID=A0A918X7C5_9ACTN|nr:dihydrofolate reductase family protein [Nocardiopsis kunsanensis]GHD15657.1 dihydrofolate reductase [Nocardiopsis kunsanensis]
MSTVYMTATSLDGFIADEENSLDWLFAADGGEAESDTEGFIATVGAVLMGATTYEWIVGHEEVEGWPYSAPTWVLTHRDLPRTGGDVRFVAADGDEQLRALHRELVEAADGRDVWLVGGGGVAADLARLGLLDVVDVSLAPVTLGAGAPLLAGRVDLRPVKVQRAGDFACLRYEVVRG